MDLYPTLAALAGLPPPPVLAEAGLDGLDFSSLVMTGVPPAPPQTETETMTTTTTTTAAPPGNSGGGGGRGGVASRNKIVRSPSVVAVCACVSIAVVPSRRAALRCGGAGCVRCRRRRPLLEGDGTQTVARRRLALPPPSERKGNKSKIGRRQKFTKTTTTTTAAARAVVVAVVVLAAFVVVVFLWLLFSAY